MARKTEKLNITMHMEPLDTVEACVKVFCTMYGCPDEASLSKYLVEKSGALKRGVKPPEAREKEKRE